MKPSIPIILIWILCLVSFRPVLGQGKLSLSFSVAPNYHYANTHFSSTFSSINAGMPVDIRIRQTGQVYSLGLLARYAVSQQISVTAGLWRNFINYQLPAITTIPDLSANPTDPQIIGIASHKRNYQIPVLVNFQSSTKRLSPYFSVGGLVDFPSITVFDDGSTGKTPNQTVRVYPTLGVGVIYQVNNQFSLAVQPTFIYILPSVTYINYLNYQLGLHAQLIYRF